MTNQAAQTMHPDALPDGTLSKSTAKRVTALAAASVSERARALLAAEYRAAGFNAAADWIAEADMDAEENDLDRCVIRALEQALTQQRGEATECVCPAEVLRLRYFADGPQGSFFTNDLQLARDLVNLYDKDDDWTITDLENPYGPSDNGS